MRLPAFLRLRTHNSHSNRNEATAHSLSSNELRQTTTSSPSSAQLFVSSSQSSPSALSSNGILPNAKNFVIQNSSFHDHSKTENTNLYVASNGLEVIRQHIAPGAMHDSAERGDPPRCHPDTRKAVIEDIMGWMKEERPSRSLLCMTGPAGSGKTSLQQTVAELCSSHILAASFFFWRTSPERNNERRLIATIAYQIAMTVRDLRPFISEAAINDPTIFEKSMESQMGKLLVDPVAKAVKHHSSRSWPYAILVDGLDECANEETQSRILRLFYKVLVSGSFPFRILLASRPEFAIRDALNQRLGDITRRIVLNDSYNPSADIELFLRSKFGEIWRRNRQQSSEIWPSDADIQKIVENSSGQFIYAATVVKFIDDRRQDPVRRLQLVLNWKPATSSGKNPFKMLDLLYTNILEASQQAFDESNGEEEATTDQLAIVRLLRRILVMSSKLSSKPISGIESLSLQFMDDFFFQDRGQTERMLSDLHSLVSVPKEFDSNEGFHFYHKSLEDFLSNSLRCRNLYIPEIGVWSNILSCCFRHICAATNEDLPHLRRQSNHTKVRRDLQFSIQMWANICLDNNYLEDDLRLALEDFCSHVEENLWTRARVRRPRLIHIKIFQWMSQITSEELFQKIRRVHANSPAWISVVTKLQSYRDSTDGIRLNYDRDLSNKWRVQTTTGDCDEIWEEV